MWQMMLLNFAIQIVSSYIKSSKSTKDDRILDLVKEGASYLAVKDNNSLEYEIAEKITKAVMSR